MSEQVSSSLICHFCFCFLSTVSFICWGKLVSLKVFPLMDFKPFIFPLAVSCKPWQPTLPPLRWIRCYGPSAVRSHQPDRQLPGKRISWVQTDPQLGSFGSQLDCKSSPSQNVPRAHRYIHSHRMQTTPPVTPTPTTACHS